MHDRVFKPIEVIFTLTHLLQYKDICRLYLMCALNEIFSWSIIMFFWKGCLRRYRWRCDKESHSEHTQNETFEFTYLHSFINLPSKALEACWKIIVRWQGHESLVQTHEKRACALMRHTTYLVFNQHKQQTDNALSLGEIWMCVISIAGSSRNERYLSDKTKGA